MSEESPMLFPFRSNGEDADMATNPPKGDGHRIGAVRDRSQTYNPKNDSWTKRNDESGRFMDQKADHHPFKGVRKERPDGK
jgi:hypothetical protein